MRRFYQLVVDWGNGQGYGVWDLGCIEEQMVESVATKVIEEHPEIRSARKINVVAIIGTIAPNGEFKSFP